MSKANLILLAIVLAGSSVASAQLSPEEFTDRFVDAFNNVIGDSNIQTVDALHLVIPDEDGEDYTVFLDNAYSLYEQDQDSLDAIVDRYVTATAETVFADLSQVTSTQIVPVVKDDAWIEDVTSSLLDRGATEATSYYYEPLAEGLSVFYAEDTPTNIRYLSLESIESLNIDESRLRETAIDNLLLLLPYLEVHGDPGLYQVVAGGNYELSLLLVDEMWTTDNFDISGDFVVALPARDILIVSGTGNDEQLTTMLELANDIYSDSPYAITPQPYVRVNGEWRRYEP